MKTKAANTTPLGAHSFQSSKSALSPPPGVASAARTRGSIFSFKNAVEPSAKANWAPPCQGLPNPLGDLLTPSRGSRQFAGMPQGTGFEVASPSRIVLEAPSAMLVIARG